MLDSGNLVSRPSSGTDEPATIGHSLEMSLVILFVKIVKYLLSAYCVPGTWDRKMNITNPCFYGIDFISKNISEHPCAINNRCY